MCRRMSLCQVALSSVDIHRSLQWYHQALGFIPVGRRSRLYGATLARVAGLPQLSATVDWLVDQQQLFQIEVFEFRRPRMRMMASDWLPSDIGYSCLGIHVTDFDDTLARIRRISGRLLMDPSGSVGERRTYIKDPDGILLKIMENDIRDADSRARPRRMASVAVRSVSLSVPDLEEARRFWVDALGLNIANVPVINGDDFGRMFGNFSLKRSSMTLVAGDFFVELNQYCQPEARARQAGSLPSDQGILNIALGTTDPAVFDAMYRRLRRFDYRLNSEPLYLPDKCSVLYVMDNQGFSVELLYVAPHAMRDMGFILEGESAGD